MVSKEENCGKPWNLLYSKHGWLQKRREGSGGGAAPPTLQTTTKEMMKDNGNY